MCVCVCVCVHVRACVCGGGGRCVRVCRGGGSRFGIACLHVVGGNSHITKSEV